MNVKLENLLTQKRSTILKKWFDVVIETYPPETALFLRRQKDSIANPVGSTIFQGIEDLFGELLKGINYERVSTYLDNIIRVRAIQDFSPSQAISFLFLLKKVIREELKKEIRENDLSRELSELDSRIDNLALLSFDIYMKCREQIYELKGYEIRSMFKACQKAGLICDIQEGEFDLKEGQNIDKL
ncbi:MAG: RsbRD N-terminal domain-containing protein [Thermodesulfovibrionales bacterium]|nr:RsbRD N-terminal domain-containing protein [Thermodesulfovibrionales bacterium]